MSTTAKEYSSLLVEEETAPLQSKSNSRKVVLGAIGLGAMGLLAGGAMGGYFASNSQHEETSSNEPDWVRALSKRGRKDSGDGNDGACPSADDYFCTYLVDDIDFDVSTAGEKEEEVKAAGSGYGNDCVAEPNGEAYARCTEHCCTTYGADLSYNQDIVANYARTVCQAGCIQTLDDGCLKVSQQSADEESKSSFFRAMLDTRSVKGYTTSEQVSAQGPGYGYESKFVCPEVICREKKYRQENCETYCGIGEYLFEGAAVVSAREAFFMGDGKKKSKKSTGSPGAPEFAYSHRYRVLFDLDEYANNEFAFPRIDFELEFDPWNLREDVFETENEGGLLFEPEFFENYGAGEELFDVCVDGCMKGCDYYEEAVRKTYGGYGGYN